MLNSLSDLFTSIGIHPVVGGFLLGVLLCIVALVMKRGLGIEVRNSSADELARFRDPHAFSSGPVNASAMTFHEGNKEMTLPPEASTAVMQALRKGSKIEAIKLFREASGLGLKESKDIIEAMQSKLGL